MTERELELITLMATDKHLFLLGDHVRKQLASMHFKGSSAEFLHHPELIKYTGNNRYKNLHIWHLIATYVAAHDKQKLKQQIFSNLENNLVQKFSKFNALNEVGQAILPLEMTHPDFIQPLFATADEPLISLFMKYLPLPKQAVFDELTVPPNIAAQTRIAQHAITSVLQKNNMDLQGVEEKIIKIQRSFRIKRRMREEMNRLANIIDGYDTEDIEESVAQAQKLEKAKLLLQEASQAYTPKCDAALSKRITNFAKKMDLYQTIRHITSSSAIESIFNESLYGRRTLLQFYIPFQPAALWASDIVNGDANAVCCGPNLIDPKASGEIEIVLDLKKVIQSHPAAFYKVCDLGFDGNIIRNVPFLDEQLKFTLVTALRCPTPNTTPIRFLRSGGALAACAELPRHSLIGYDLKNMSQILTLNFFKFMDHAIYGEDYIANLYKKLAQMTDEQLELFLKQVASEFTKTAEFNFYGAYKLDLSSVLTISKKGKQDHNYTLNLNALCHSLNSGNLQMLVEAQTIIPTLFKSYRFLDYLISVNSNPLSKRALDVLRKQCRVPGWLNNDYYDALIIDESDEALFIVEPKQEPQTSIDADVNEDPIAPGAIVPTKEEVRMEQKNTQVVVDPAMNHHKDQCSVISTAVLESTTLTTAVADTSVSAATSFIESQPRSQMTHAQEVQQVTDHQPLPQAPPKKESNSLFDSMITITPDVNAVTLLINKSPARAVLILESIDQDGKHILRFVEYIPTSSSELAANKASHGNIHDCTLQSPFRRNLKEITDDIKHYNSVRLNTERLHSNNKENICPEIYPYSYSTSYGITKEKAAQLILNLSHEKDQPPQVSDSASYATQHLSNIGISLSLGRDEDPALGCTPSYHFLLQASCVLLSVVGLAALIVGIVAILGCITAITGGAAIAVAVIGGISAVAGGAAFGFFSSHKPNEASISSEPQFGECRPGI
ncbi:MAG: hypothetical protein ACHP65_05910 [Legionellales bacterium]